MIKFFKSLFCFFKFFNRRVLLIGDDDVVMFVLADDEFFDGLPDGVESKSLLQSIMYLVNRDVSKS